MDQYDISQIGPQGERTAAEYLKKNGYKIIDHNYKVCGSEVDLIAFKDETLCFVEVKTRGTDKYGLPEEFVDRRKIRKIIRAAKIFTGTKTYADCYVRFDIIAVLNKGEEADINHIKHAFQDE
ncbi:MAG: YraN family protein [bacterium]|nr:YraN family protein [bacterium]